MVPVGRGWLADKGMSTPFRPFLTFESPPRRLQVNAFRVEPLPTSSVGLDWYARGRGGMRAGLGGRNDHAICPLRLVGGGMRAAMRARLEGARHWVTCVMVTPFARCAHDWWHKGVMRSE